RQRLAVLDFLLAPAAGVLLKIGIVVEDSAQVMGVRAAIVFDKTRGLDDPHDLRIELILLEAIPGNVVERPMAHGAPPLWYVQTPISGSPYRHNISGTRRRRISTTQTSSKPSRRYIG